MPTSLNSSKAKCSGRYQIYEFLLNSLFYLECFLQKMSIEYYRCSLRRKDIEPNVIVFVHVTDDNTQ